MNKGADRTNDWMPGFLAILALATGSGLQLALIIRNNFPLTDGGMLYVMINNLISNGYRLPAYTTYNFLEIPFAYPPLPLYWTALLHGWLGISLFELFRWLPWLFCSLAIPAFGLFGLALLQSRRRAALAMLVFALLLPAFNRNLMGGGLTRAPGLFFSLLALSWIFRMFYEHNRRYLPLAIVFSGLTVLSHSVYAWFVIYTSAVNFLFSQPRRRDVFNALWVIVGVLLMASPWLLSVVLQHGMTPLWAASQTRSTLPLMVTLSQLLFFTGLGHEYFLNLLGVMVVIGLVLAFIEQKFIYALWLLVIFVLERSAPTHLAIIPFAMLAGMAIDKLIFDNPLIANRRGRLILLASFNYLFFITLVAVFFTLDAPVLSVSERQTMDWVDKHTLPDSRFVVLGRNDWWEDPLSEWFPALAERQAINTVQGSEWIAGGEFFRRIGNYDSLRQCLTKFQTNCLVEWSQNTGLVFDYVVISLEDKQALSANPLVQALHASNLYQVVFEQDGSVVWKFR